MSSEPTCGSECGDLCAQCVWQRWCVTNIIGWFSRCGLRSWRSPITTLEKSLVWLQWISISLSLYRTFDEIRSGARSFFELYSKSEFVPVCVDLKTTILRVERFSTTHFYISRSTTIFGGTLNTVVGKRVLRTSTYNVIRLWCITNFNEVGGVVFGCLHITYWRHGSVIFVGSM